MKTTFLLLQLLGFIILQMGLKWKKFEVENHSLISYLATRKDCAFPTLWVLMITNEEELNNSFCSQKNMIANMISLR